MGNPEENQDGPTGDGEQSDAGEGFVLDGRVKWYDPAKGYGFVVADEVKRDVLLHGNVLRAFGRNSVVDGSTIRIRAQETERGIQAVEVLSVDPPAKLPDSMPDIRDLAIEDISALEIEPARVKWFDRARGFGFATVFGRSDDVFIHIEVLRASGLADLEPGEAVALRLVDGRRGKLAVEVLAWDAGIGKT